jgi:MurNAc alpha-1-phosphate uridylyltransferase
VSSGDLAVVVLAAGEGTRLRPLTRLRPKPLCPVGNVALLDLAIARADRVAGPLDPDRLAVNAHHLAEQVVAHVDGAAHVSVELPEALGTAGALGRLREWIAGRDVLVCNGDAWLDGELDSLVCGWDHERPRLLVVADSGSPDFGGRWRFAGASLLTWRDVAGLPAEPAGLYERLWRGAERAGRLDLSVTGARFVDCGTPSDYLRANLLASGGDSVVAPDAVVDGELVRSVVWPGSVVRRGERLVECVRAGDLTVAAPQ